MTPDSSTPPDGSPLPPRHRPALGNLAQDTTEIDLWELDEDLETTVDDTAGQTDAPLRLKPLGKDVPAPRDRQENKPPAPEPKVKPPAVDAIRINVANTRGKATRSYPESSISKTESDFDDLESWDDSVDDSMPLELEKTEALAEEPPAPEPQAPEPIADPTPEEDEKPGFDDEFNPIPKPDAKPLSFKLHLKLSGTERIGLMALAVMLIVGIVAIVVHSANRLPSGSTKTRETDFPVKGERLTIESATSYWREPLMEGPRIDTFRRGTILLPELEMKVSGGPAAIRVLFRNDEGVLIGDAVNRMITGAESLKIPATAGFDDFGMHAAYRTGNDKPWTIEVLEAPAETTVGKEFKKVFEMNISAARR